VRIKKEKKVKFIIPLIIFLIIVASLFRKLPTYEIFISGAEEGLKIVIGIFPAMLAVVTAAYMMRASGAIDLIINIISPITDFFHIPKEVMPLALIRPISGSGALGILTDILKNYGADSVIGKTASVIMGSTETTFYCLCVYFAKTKVKYTMRAIPCAVLGDIVGILAGVIIIKLVNF
jgi:spore maturation protein B